MKQEVVVREGSFSVWGTAVVTCGGQFTQKHRLTLRKEAPLLHHVAAILVCTHMSSEEQTVQNLHSLRTLLSLKREKKHRDISWSGHL